MEASMTGILDKFYVEHSSQGVRVLARSQQLTSICASEEEIESNLQTLKDDLDACAKEMKRLLVIDRRGSLFEGWPSVQDDQLIG
jgi:hypothetical protein